MKKYLIIILSVIPGALFGNFNYQPENLDFERGYPGNPVPMWTFPLVFERSGFISYLSDENPAEGRYCAYLKYPENSNEETPPMGFLLQSVDATPYRGKKASYSGAVRTSLLGEGAELWVQVKLDKDSILLEKRMIDAKIISATWSYHGLEFIVPDNAAEIRFGLMINGGGEAWLDDVDLSIVQPSMVVTEEPAPLNKTQLTRLSSFAKAYSALRYYYPSFDVYDYDWESYLVNSVKYLNNSKFDIEKNLSGIFSEIAPAAKFNSGNPGLLVTANEMFEAYGHLHEGGFNTLPTPVFSSKLHNIFSSVRLREAAAIQTINAAGMGGERIRLSGFIKMEQFTPGANAQLWLRGDREGRQVAFALTTNDNPAIKNEWQEFVIETDTLPDDILNLRIGLVLIGDGNAFFDDIKLESKNSGEIIEIRNPGFETSMNNDAVTGWFVPGTVYNAGYVVEVSAAERNSGNYSLSISTDENTAPNFPNLDRIFEIILDDKLTLKFPALSGADKSGKLNSAGSMRIPERIYPEGFHPETGDRVSRLAIIIDLWSAIRQFSLRNIEPHVLDSALTSCLAKAALDDEREKFEVTLNSLASLTYDSQCRVWQSGILPEASLPFLLKYAGGKILVTSVSGNFTKINPGDELIMIDGEGARDYIGKQSQFIPAANSSWAYARAIAQFRSGEKGSETNLKFKDPAGDVKEITIVRNRRVDEVTESRPEVFSEVADSVTYLDLTYIDDRAFKEIAPELKDSKAIVFDLRGQTRMSEHFLGFFLEKPVEFLEWRIPVYTMPGKESKSYRKIKGQIDGRNLMPDKKLLFLCDERTSGYAEAILWAVQYYGLGEIIGSPTAGSPGETIAYRLPGLFNFTMTSVEGFLPDGKSIFGKPVIPGFEIYPEPASLSESGDLQLRKALELAVQ